MGHILYVALGMGMASCGDDSVRVEIRQRRDRERTEKGLFGRREGEKNLRKYLKVKSEKLFGYFWGRHFVRGGKIFWQKMRFGMVFVGLEECGGPLQDRRIVACSPLDGRSLAALSTDL